MSSSKGILFIDAATSSGEGQRNLGAIISRLDDSNYRAYVLSADDSESGLVSRFKVDKKVPVEFIELTGWSRQNEAMFGWIPDLLKIRSVIRKWLNEYDIDMVYANGFYAGLLCSLTVPRRFPLLFHARDYHCADVAVDYIVKRAAGSIFVSNFIQNHWLGKVGEAYADTVTTVFNGFDWDEERQVLEKFSFRDGYVWPDETIFVTAVADMSSTGNHELFLRAFEIAYSKNPHLFALVIGCPRDSSDYDYLDNLEAIARDSRIIGAVSFLEFVDNIGPLIAASNVVVSIADNEPFGESVVHAMANAKRIVVTAGSGPEELARDYGATEIVNPDANSIAEGIIAAIADGNSPHSSSNGVSDIIKRFTIKRQIDAIDRFISERVQC